MLHYLRFFKKARELVITISSKFTFEFCEVSLYVITLALMMTLNISLVSSDTNVSAVYGKQLGHDSLNLVFQRLNINNNYKSAFKNMT